MELEIEGISADGKLLNVKRTEPDEWFKRGGRLHGYRQYYGINHYSFQTKEFIMEMTGITEQEYYEWDAKFTTRYNPETEEWSEV